MTEENVVDETVTAQPEAVEQLTEVVPERTDDDIQTQAGIEVVLAGKTIEIPILSYARSRKLRPKFIEWQEVAGQVAAEAKRLEGGADGDPAHFNAIVKAAKGQYVFVDAAIDLFFLYAADAIDKAIVEDTATQEELWDASQAVIDTIVPLSSKMVAKYQ